MNRHCIQFVVSFLVFVLSGSTRAVDFAGGTGEYGDPYQIATAEQLLSIRTLNVAPSVTGDPATLPVLDRHFILINDIDLDPNLSQDYVLHQPLVKWFSGVFDGNGFCIRHLTLEGTGEEDLGLFGNVARSGEVRHLVLEDARVSHFSPYWQICALCVWNQGLISKCSVTGVLSGRWNAGGLVVGNYGIVEECRSICTLSAEEMGGGLVCFSKGLIRDCHASGRVSAGYAAGGLVADGVTSAIHRCYAACQIDSGAFYSGGLVGRVEDLDEGHTARILDSYFLDPCDGGGPDNGFGTPLTSAQMKQRASFARWGFAEPDNSFSSPWFMVEDATPELASFVLRAVPMVGGLSIEDAQKAMEEAGFRVDEVVYDYDHAIECGRAITARPYPAAPAGTTVDIVASLGGYNWPASANEGSDASPYVIVSAGQLDCLAYQPELWNGCFSLESNLDMTGRMYRRSLLGRSVPWGPVLFNGVFRGNGHVIRNLTIEASPAQTERVELLGLFGGTGWTARIEDLGLAWVSVKGLWSTTGTAGMFCAANWGRIDRCYCRGVLEWRGQLGGLVGENAGEITDCYAEGSVKRTGTDDDGDNYAGLVARNYNGSIDTCYAACTISPLGVGDGFVAVAKDGIKYCLWDVEISGTELSAGGTGLTTREMMDVQVLKDHGWGTSLFWVFDDGQDYPRLFWEGPPLW